MRGVRITEPSQAKAASLASIVSPQEYRLFDRARQAYSHSVSDGMRYASPVAAEMRATNSWSSSKETRVSGRAGLDGALSGVGTGAGGGAQTDDPAIRAWATWHPVLPPVLP